MSPKENDPNYEVKSQGSAPKAQATVKQTLIIDRATWNVSSIAWNKAGDVIILDPTVAARLSEKAQMDKELEIGIPPSEVRLGIPDPEDPPTGVTIIQPEGEKKVIPKPLELCVCDRLFFKLVKINEPVTQNIPGGII